MNLLPGAMPAAMVLVPAAFCAFEVCALGTPALFSSVLLLLHAPAARSAAVASPSASARVFMPILLFVYDTKWPGRDTVPGRAILSSSGQERRNDRRDELGRRVD